MATKKQATEAGVKRIFWKEDEKQTVVNAVALALHKGEAKSALQALNIAQHLLPEERRRPTIHSVGPESMPWFRPMLDKALDKIKKAEAKAAAAAEAEAKAAQAQAEAAAAAAAEAEADKANREKLREELAPDFAARDAAHASLGLNGHHHPVATTPVVRTELVAAGLGHAMLNLRAMLVDQLASVFVEAAVKAMGSLGGTPQVPVDLSGLTPQAQPPVEPAKPEATWDKPRPAVLVVGLAGQQHIEVEKRFARMLDLRFVGRDEAKDKLRDESDKAEVAIVMTDRVSPSQFDIVKARAQNIIPQAGGLQHLQSTLTNMVSAAASTSTH